MDNINRGRAAAGTMSQGLHAPDFQARCGLDIRLPGTVRCGYRAVENMCTTLSALQHETPGIANEKTTTANIFCWWARQFAALIEVISEFLAAEGRWGLKSLAANLIDVVLVEDKDDLHAVQSDLLQIVAEAVERLHLLGYGHHDVHQGGGIAALHNAHLADKNTTNSYTYLRSRTSLSN